MYINEFLYTYIMKYFIFAGEKYYPAGGMRDLYGTATTLKDATSIAKEAVEVGSKPYGNWWKHSYEQPTERSNNEEIHPCDWAQIVELSTMKILADVKTVKEIIKNDKENEEYKYISVANFIWH